MMSRWMLWHRLHCSVQYSEDFRPPKTRSTERRPLHSGQCDRTADAGCACCAVSSCVIDECPFPDLNSGCEFWARHALAAGPTQPETVDVALGIGDGRLAAGPGEADFERRKADTVDHQRGAIGTPDSGMPKPSSSLETFDGEVVVKAGHGRVPFWNGETSTGRLPRNVKPFTGETVFVGRAAGRPVGPGDHRTGQPAGGRRPPPAMSARAASDDFGVESNSGSDQDIAGQGRSFLSSSLFADASSPGWRRGFVSSVYRLMTSSATAPCR